MVSTRLCGLTYQQSPSRAARRMAGSALAPIQMGGCGFCTGLVPTDAPCKVKCEPTMSTASSVHSRLTASKFSSKRCTRSFWVVPKARNSTSR